MNVKKVTAANKDECPMLADFLDLVGKVKDLGKDVNHLLDNPHYISRFLVVDAMKLFHKLSGRYPTKIFVPPILEASLQLSRNYQMEHPVKLREENKDCLFGVTPVWDAECFGLE